MRKEAFTVGDLRVALTPLSLVRRKAILFALEARLKPTTVMMLRWRVARAMELPTLARDILKSMPQHIHIETVFWEELETRAAVPLFQLEETLFLASQYTWEELQSLYDRMVFVDAGAEVESFTRAMRAG
jgi:hypothetical protein